MIDIELTEAQARWMSGQWVAWMELAMLHNERCGGGIELSDLLSDSPWMVSVGVKTLGHVFARIAGAEACHPWVKP